MKWPRNLHTPETVVNFVMHGCKNYDFDKLCISWHIALKKIINTHFHIIFVCWGRF